MISQREQKFVHNIIVHNYDYIAPQEMTNWSNVQFDSFKCISCIHSHRLMLRKNLPLQMYPMWSRARCAHNRHEMFLKVHQMRKLYSYFGKCQYRVLLLKQIRRFSNYVKLCIFNFLSTRHSSFTFDLDINKKQNPHITSFYR